MASVHHEPGVVHRQQAGQFRDGWQLQVRLTVYSDRLTHYTLALRAYSCGVCMSSVTNMIT
jgi:hypothetical protein